MDEAKDAVNFAASLRKILSSDNMIAVKTGCKGLTERGVQQAEQLARRLKHEAMGCDILLSASIKRTQDTATIIGHHLNQPVQINDDLCELFPGDADGLSWTQYQQQYGEVDLTSNPDTPFAPNGESWNQFVQRVQTTLTTLHQSYDGQDIVAVTHAGFIVVSFILWFEMPFFNRLAEIHPRYASITEWQVTDETWQLIRFNNTSHLSSEN